MIIMQRDLLAELHLHEIDLKSLQKIVTQNSARLAYLIKESNECLSKSKIIPLHFKKVVGSMLSDFTTIGYPISTSKENIQTLKRKFILKKSPVSSENALTNGVETSNHPSRINSPAAPNAVQECNDNKEDNDKNMCVEKLQSLQNSLLNIEIPPSKETFRVTESDIRIETEPLKGDIACSLSEEKTEIKLPFVKPPGYVSLPLSSGISILKRKSSISSRAEDVLESAIEKNGIEQPERTPDFNKDSETAFCVISEVVGNATAAFCGADDTEEIAKEVPEVQLITPKKTNDITKIKGWRRKQFFVEKPTTIEFYSIAKGSLALRKKINLSDKDDSILNLEEPGNVENAFVCDSLDDFLDREAELKIGYEIPHLYAEFGIKLTRDEIVSKPNLSENDIKEVETRYCVPVSLPCDTIDLDDIKEESIKGIKRPIGDDPKHCKILKLDENKRQPIRLGQKLEYQPKIESGKNFSECKSSSDEMSSNDSTLGVLKQSDKNLNKVKLVNKLIALVVYPGPSAPLHPVVQYHLNKIRSYRTKVDRDWATFAASAVLVNEEQYKRRILPAFCCAKIETNTVGNNNNNNSNNNNNNNSNSNSNSKNSNGNINSNNSNNNNNNNSGSSSSGNNSSNNKNNTDSNKEEKNIQKQVDCASATSSKLEDYENMNKKQIKLKKCSVVLEKLNSVDTRLPWCMEHNCYNCVQCGLGKPKYKNLSFRKDSKKIRVRNEDIVETVIVSPRASFDKKVANLLAKKVRLLKINGDTLKSIDCLKTLTTNTVEFIKLKFVKESFLSGYLNIWYLKADETGVRSRAFLTFSHTPPVPNAINLKSSAFSLNNLPKVITEIVSTENTFDSNEYAILHCDGKIWEIHGSLNIAFGKCDKNIEQIFTSAELPELKTLQEIAYDILRVRAVKWWVLDLTQKFRLMELKSGNVSVIVTRKKFIETVELNLFGFVSLRKNSEGRVLGAFIMQRLLPFVLIGPYYLLEANDLVLKSESSSIPFTYYGEENVTANYPLKFFINSVIKNLGKYEKKLEGLWLYDKMCLDKTSYLEVVTTNWNVPPPKKYSSIDIEHGYSLNSLTNSTPPGSNSGIVRRKDGKEEFKKITVFLYFDIFELGFVEGELQFDNSVIISHPLDKRTKMKSHKIGDWFIGIIKRRIEFIPKDLVVRWFITKHKDDLRERRPFNKFFLGGAHILTRNGVFYLLEMSDSKMEKLGIDRNEIVRAIAQSEVIREVKELKNLSNLLVNDPNKSLSMYEVLTKAVNEIKKLRKLQRTLKNEKNIAEKEKLNLCSCLIKKLNQCRISFHLKIKIIEKLEPLFRNDNGDLSEEFAKKLKGSRIGRKYLKRVERNCAKIRAQGKNCNRSFRPEKEEMNKSESAKSQFVFSTLKRSIQERISPLKKSLPAILNVSKTSTGTKGPPKYSEFHIQIEKLGTVSDQFAFKNIYPKILKNSASMKEFPEKNNEKEKIKSTECIAEKLPNDFMSKSDKFLKLTSPELPNNIKLCWKNWNVNKLKVV